VTHIEPAPTASEIIMLAVDAAGAGYRLDKFLASQLAERSRATIQKWIADGHVTVDGAAGRASQRLSAGQSVCVDVPPAVRCEPFAQRIALSVLYEDDYLAVVDKPAGMVVHPAAGHWEGTLVNALMGRYPDLQEAGGFEDEPASNRPPRPGIVHRLDKDTSGLIVVAKTTRIAELLQGQFQARQVEKTYLALVEGVPAVGDGQIDAPIGRDPRQRKRMAATPTGRPAQTGYRVVGRFGDYALVEVHPRTGRTHQVRVHLAFIGHPIVGDLVYGRRRSRLACGRQFLHAWKLSFTHPVSGAPMSFEAPLPDDLRAVLAQLEAEAS